MTKKRDFTKEIENTNDHAVLLASLTWQKSAVGSIADRAFCLFDHTERTSGVMAAGEASNDAPQIGPRRGPLRATGGEMSAAVVEEIALGPCAHVDHQTPVSRSLWFHLQRL